MFFHWDGLFLFYSNNAFDSAEKTGHYHFSETEEQTMSTQTTMPELEQVAHRIREMREIMGYSEETMAQRTEVPLGVYREYESCKADLPFTFIYKCALAFGIELTELLEGRSAKLRS